MKSNFKKASLLITGILTGGTLMAQSPDTSHMSSDYVKPFSGNSSYRTWSIGIDGGVLTPYTIFGTNKKQDYTSPNGNLGYGGYIKDQITPAFGIQADFLAGKLTGDNSQPLPNNAGNFSNFSTQIHYAVSLSGNITVGNISWKDNRSAIQPYVTAGFGTMNYTPVITYNGTTENFKTDNNGAINEVYMPVGVGLKFNLSPLVNLDLGYQVNFAYTDNLEGYVFGPDNRFSYAHIGLEFALGSRSKPQLAVHNPVSSMRDEYIWQNEHTKSMLEAQIEAQKAQNDQLKSDLAAATANFAKLTMDSDGDGVSDFFDKCPNTPPGTKVDGSGCPLPIAAPVPETKVFVTEQDREVVKEAIRNLEFDFGKATIREHSLPSLDKVAQLLIDKKFHLKLAGYTDNVGSVAFNLGLSKDRAEAIKDYLVSKGADASMIQADGFGKADPIASNRTAKGRQLNRRVEFSLY